MSKTKKCKKCGIELPATTEYFHKVKGNKDGLHGSCKKCRNKQSREAARKRRAEGRHLIHSLVCDWCNKNFKSDTKNQRFCSIDCQYDWQRESDEYKEIHKNNGLKPGEYNQYGSLEEREQRFKKQFENMYHNFKYHSGYSGANGYFKSECKICGHIQKRSAQVGRPSRSKIEIQCDNCNEMNRLRKDLIDMLNKIYKEEERITKKKVESETESLQNIWKKHKYYLECRECGREYFSSFKRITCSAKCRIKRNNRVKEVRRRKRLRLNGRIDWDISIERLIKRDGKACYLCGKDIDFKDCTIDDNGTWICGDNYPSIDHVVPVSKGGTHTWDNVRLAHRHCNTIKSDNNKMITM